ncbi:hypothetical protein GH733_016591 [Mirounga leonina]|nr:hypothetical protein GH733_016591 [Mirounga leonina]
MSSLYQASAAGPTPSTGSSSPSWRQRTGTSLPKTRKESRGGPSRQGVALLRSEPLHRGTADTLLNWVKKLPCQITSYLVAHTLGRRMLYPGSVYLLQKALMPVLLQGQARLVEECNGRRAKLLACDGNEIDTMFVDRRGTAEPQGQKLVRRGREPRGSWGPVEALGISRSPAAPRIMPSPSPTLKTSWCQKTLP